MFKKIGLSLFLAMSGVAFINARELNEQEFEQRRAEMRAIIKERYVDSELNRRCDQQPDDERSKILNRYLNCLATRAIFLTPSIARTLTPGSLEELYYITTGQEKEDITKEEAREAMEAFMGAMVVDPLTSEQRASMKSAIEQQETELWNKEQRRN